MVDIRRAIGVTQICLGILLIIGTTYFSNLFAAAHIQFTENASSHFSTLERQGIITSEHVPEYATIHANYILLSNLYIMLFVNFGISTLIIIIGIIMILQGIVNKFAIPSLRIGYKPLLWLGLLGFVTIFILLVITQYFVRYYFT
jgi:hypothetical protein